MLCCCVQMIMLVSNVYMILHVAHDIEEAAAEEEEAKRGHGSGRGSNRVMPQEPFQMQLQGPGWVAPRRWDDDGPPPPPPQERWM